MNKKKNKRKEPFLEYQDVDVGSFSNEKKSVRQRKRQQGSDKEVTRFVINIDIKPPLYKYIVTEQQ